MIEKVSENKVSSLMHRQEYSSHRQRLANIKQSQLSEFTIQEPYRKGSHYKKLMMVKMYQQKIGHENKLLQKKIYQINGRNKILSQSIHRTEKVTRNLDSEQPVQKQDNQFRSSQGFVLSQNRKKNNSSYQRRSSNVSSRYRSSHQQSLPLYVGSKQKKILGHSLYYQTSKSPQQKDQVYYNQPERYEQRTVMYKKTYIVNSLQSCLVEISMVQQRIIIVGYLMGEFNQTLKLFLTKSQTYHVLSESFSDWEVIGSRIYIDNTQNGRTLKIAPMPTKFENQSIERQKQSTSKNKQMQKKQKEFIQRNYYTIIQRQKQKIEQQQKQKQKQRQNLAKDNTVKINQVVQRLAKHKEYPVSDHPAKELYNKQAQSRKQSKESKNINYNKKIVKNQINIQQQRSLKTNLLSKKIDGILYKANIFPTQKYNGKSNSSKIEQITKKQQSLVQKVNQKQKIIKSKYQKNDIQQSKLKQKQNQKQQQKISQKQQKQQQHHKQQYQDNYEDNYEEDNKKKSQKGENQNQDQEQNYEDDYGQDLIKDVSEQSNQNYEEQDWKEQKPQEQTNNKNNKTAYENSNKNKQIQAIQQTSFQYETSYYNKNEETNKINIDKLINKDVIYQNKQKQSQNIKIKQSKQVPDDDEVYDQDFNQSLVHKQVQKNKNNKQQALQQNYEQQFQQSKIKEEEIDYQDQFDN